MWANWAKPPTPITLTNIKNVLFNQTTHKLPVSPPDIHMLIDIIWSVNERKDTMYVFALLNVSCVFFHCWLSLTWALLLFKQQKNNTQIEITSAIYNSNVCIMEEKKDRVAIKKSGNQEASDWRSTNIYIERNR